jgi:hypothetical protein
MERIHVPVAIINQLVVLGVKLAFTMHPVIAPLSPIETSILVKEGAETISLTVAYAALVSGACLIEDLVLACRQFYIFTGRRLITELLDSRVQS